MASFNEALVRAHIQKEHPNFSAQQTESVLGETRRRFEEEERKARAVSSSKKYSYRQWLERNFPNMDWVSPIYKLLIDTAQAVIDGDITQVIINVPPRTGKSVTITEKLPAYWLGQRPQDGVIIGSYSKELAGFFASSALANYQINNGSLVDMKRVEEWNNIYGGFVKAVGVGSGVTGRGAECFTAGTMVATPGGARPIEEIVPGDLVLGADTLSYRTEPCVVEAVRSSTAQSMTTVWHEGGQTQMTQNQRYWVHGRGWVMVTQRRPDDLVFNLGVGLRQLDGHVFWDKRATPVYDLQVTNHHNFFANGLLVHNCVIIDDPVKNYAEANSPAYQMLVWNWWLNDIRTRRNRLSKTPTIVIMTRWQEADLAGKILTGQLARDWELIRVPALAYEPNEVDPTTYQPFGPDPIGRPPGESILPHRFSEQDFHDLRLEMGTDFDGLYQQIPHSAARHSFDTTQLRIVPIAPADCFRVRYFDRAGSAGKGDWTVGLLMAYDDSSDIAYIEHVVRGQWGDEGVDAVMEQTVKMDSARWAKTGKYQFWFEQEPASSGKAIANQTVRKFAGHDVHADRPSDNKSVRAKPLASYINAGNVRLVEGEWNQALIEEYRRYIAFGPAKQVDDQVDAGSGAFMKCTVERMDVTFA